MKSILIPIILTLLVACRSAFEPKLTGWTATNDIREPIIYLDINGRLKSLQLPKHDGIGFGHAQWTKSENQLLLTQSRKNNHCNDYQIISMDTSGIVIDTIFTAPSKTAIDFMLAPNDSLLMLKTYDWPCRDQTNHTLNFKFTFLNRFSKNSTLDTIKVGNALSITINETAWSPDSKKVIIAEWVGNKTSAFTFDLTTKDTSFIDTGSNFTWSPADKNIVAYVKDNSLYTKNIHSGEKQLIFKGRRKKHVGDFRWNPTGDFLVINVYGYSLNIPSYILWKPTHFYMSMPAKVKSKTLPNSLRIDTWK